MSEQDNTIIFPQVKQCRRCYKNKTFPSFSRDNKYRDGYDTQCRICKSHEYKTAREKRRLRYLAEHPEILVPPVAPEGMRWCRKCHHIKLLSDFYKTGEKSYRGECRDCCKKAGAAYRGRHQEAINARRQKRRKANPTLSLAKWRQYYQCNKKKLRKAGQQWYQKNSRQVIARNRQWWRNNPVKARALKAKEYARRHGAPINDFTAEQWQAVQEVYRYRCAYCGIAAKGKLTMDHLTPLSQGGAHTLRNIAPACRSCNSRKHAGPVLKPVQPLLLVGG